MDEENVLPEHVVALFRELGCVLDEARGRLEALLRDAVPAQDTRTPQADPGSGGR